MSSTSFLAFLAVVTAASAVAHAYAWRRLVRDPAWPRGARRAAAWALVVLVPAPAAGFGLWWWAGAQAVRPVTWAGSFWAGVVFLAVACLLATDLLRLLAWAAARLAGRARARDPDRRRRAARWRAAACAVGAGTIAAVGALAAARPPEVLEVRVPVAGLPEAFDGFVIAQLSDLHAGPLLDRAFVEGVVARTNALEPDLVAITGDVVDGQVASTRETVAPLAGLRAPHGVWFVLGNHDAYSGADAWASEVAALGIRVLRGERATIWRGGSALDIVGIDDPATRGPPAEEALAAALRGRPTGRPVVLLAHQPRAVWAAARAGVSLQLSGHTHAGQILPFGFLLPLVQPAVKGLHRFGDTWLYVSRGTGWWGPPMLVFGPSEITRVVLERAP